MIVLMDNAMKKILFLSLTSGGYNDMIFDACSTDFAQLDVPPGCLYSKLSKEFIFVLM